MNDQVAGESVQSAVSRLYAAPLADFIRTRDALAKELRSSGARDDASVVKSLRKPSRSAWSLNCVMHDQPATVLALEEAVTGFVDAHAGGRDVRAAMVALRAAVRVYAVRAAEASRDAGFALDVSDLSGAILAVLGHPDSYGELRRGRLTEVPEAGGLDLLATLSGGPGLEVLPPARSAPSVDPAVTAAAREQARLAVEALEASRTAVEAADAVFAKAESDVAAAQEDVQRAQSSLNAALQRREFARRSKEAAGVELRTAEAASHAAQMRLGNLT